VGELETEHPSLRAHLLWILAIFAMLFLGLTAYLYITSRSVFAEALEHELSGDLEWMASLVARDPGLLSSPVRADSLCRAVSSFKGFRITVIDTSGRVGADSHVPSGELGALENHRDRPEVKSAREQGWGHAWRYSNTLGMDMLYVARRLPNHQGYLRAAAGPTALWSFRKASLRVFALFLGLFLAASGAVTWWISRKISAPLLHLVGPNVTPRWEAEFREAEVLNRAFEGYVEEVRKLGGEVEAERDKLVSVLNQLEEGIIILSSEGRVLAANPSSLRLLGSAAEIGNGGNGGSAAWLGRLARDVLRHEPLTAWVDSAQDPDRPALLHVDKGPESPYDLLCHLAALDSSSPSNGREYLLTLFDVTEFRHLDRVKSEFVANASHELKTPLSSIKGYAEALLEGALADVKVREPFVRKIHGNALRLERLVQDLLALSHLEANPAPKETEPLPLRGYVNAAANLHRQGLEGFGIRMENHVPDDVRVVMEPRDLELILNNLVGNAIKYNRPGGKVKVGTEASGEEGGLRFYVKDTGIGISAPMLPRIFERFYRADASRARQDGTGLGLAIVKHAAGKYGMTVSAESTLGEGSKFQVDMPSALVLPQR
jgi:two-component system phosphate regulon sensor histidine kinase PhoR